MLCNSCKSLQGRRITEYIWRNNSSYYYYLLVILINIIICVLSAQLLSWTHLYAHLSALEQSSHITWRHVGGWRGTSYLPDSSSLCQCPNIIPEWKMVYKGTWISSYVPSKWEVCWCFFWNPSQHRKWWFSCLNWWTSDHYHSAGNLLFWIQQWILSWGLKKWKLVCWS